jgi:hypothetical protein
MNNLLWVKNDESNVLTIFTVLNLTTLPKLLVVVNGPKGPKRV